MAFLLFFGVFVLNLLIFQRLAVVGSPLEIMANEEHKRERRYAFQITHHCKNFPKAFLCVSECLNRNFQIAHSDKHCRCRCFDKRHKYKYNPFPVPTEVPRTSIPDWLIQILIKKGKWKPKNHNKKNKEDDNHSDESEGSGSSEEDGSGDHDSNKHHKHDDVPVTGATTQDGEGTGATDSHATDRAHSEATHETTQIAS